MGRNAAGAGEQAGGNKQPVYKDTCRYLQEILSENKDPYLVKEFNVWIKEIKKNIKIKAG